MNNSKRQEILKKAIMLDIEMESVRVKRRYVNSAIDKFMSLDDWDMVELFEKERSVLREQYKGLREATRKVEEEMMEDLKKIDEDVLYKIISEIGNMFDIKTGEMFK